MRFSGREIPGELLKLARNRMKGATAFTPNEIRSHLLLHGRQLMIAVHGIEANHPIIADRVFKEARRQLTDAGEIAPLKRGVWAKTSFLRAAAAESEAR